MALSSPASGTSLGAGTFVAADRAAAATVRSSSLWRDAVRRLLRNRLALLGLIVVVALGLIAIFADFLAPYDYRSQLQREPMAPPTTIRFRDEHGRWHIRPSVCAQQLTDPLKRSYFENRSQCFPLDLFAHGYRYKLLGIFEADYHLIGVKGAGSDHVPRVNLLGTDDLGRDRLSRLLIATRFSLLVGPLGTILASLLGVLLGCIAGYTRRWIDTTLMHLANAMMAVPPLIMILAARATFPLELPPTSAATLLIVIFVILGWAEMACLTRSLVFELSEREYVLAAVSVGLPPQRILYRHILPNAAPLLLVQIFLMLPNFLLFETALSFLGVGLQEPEPSWGNLLATARDSTLLHPGQTLLLLSPALTIVIFIFGVRLFRDGIKRGDGC